jgi:tetratricopeptide (TPR) repeat protein
MVLDRTPLRWLSVMAEHRSLKTVSRVAAFFLIGSAGALVALPGGPGALGQAAGGRSSESPMQQHYDAAFRLQAAGKLVESDAEHKAFVAMALHRIANARANLGEYAQAVPLYDAALALAANDGSLDLDYAGAALDAHDAAKAKLLAESVEKLLPKHDASLDTSLTSILAQALWGLGDHEQALDQLKAAVAAKPDAANLYALAYAYLALSDTQNGAKVFAEMQRRLGDSAALHMRFGRGYAETFLFEEAIGEFKKAISMDDRLTGVHYSLGAATMQLYAERGYPEAEAEFRRELALHPADTFSYPQLARIAISQHRLAEAERDLKRAVALNPSGPSSAGTYLVLGQLYMDTERVPEAEAALRKTIEVTLDPSANNYEVQRAHFWLGRMRMQDGDSAGGRKELNISRDLLHEKEKREITTPDGKTVVPLPLDRTRIVKPAEAAAEKAFESKAGPLIASSYDNLGVHAAMRGEYAGAAAYFAHAVDWNPTLSSAEKNWGRAAIAAEEYAQAVKPLTRYVAAHSSDLEARSMLGLSEYLTRDYADALATLQPMSANLRGNLLLELAYAGAMARAGTTPDDRAEGMTQLKGLVAAHPESPIAHCVLGEVYASAGQYELSVEELHAAMLVDPVNAEARYALALDQIALGQKAEANRLLSELAEGGAKDADVYFQLGRLQLELGSIKAAVNSLEAATKMSPTNADYHRELADAYRRNAQGEEAEREAQQSESLRAQPAADGQSDAHANPASTASSHTNR